MSIVERLKDTLSAPRNDDMLHFSQHLQHDRHAALYHAYGYPDVKQTWQRIFPLVQGSGIHEIVHHTMSGLYPKYVGEHSILAEDKRLRYRWGGTADAYMEDESGQVWLLDYKTISGVGMSFLGDEPKPEHVLQVSAYYHFGPTQNCKTAVLYLPSSGDYKKRWEEPLMIEFEPVSKDELVERMRTVEKACDEYMGTSKLPDAPTGTYKWKPHNAYAGHRTRKKLLYTPHYMSMFCPWASLTDDPCGCSLERGRTLAVWEEGELSEYDEKDLDLIHQIGLPDADENPYPMF